MKPGSRLLKQGRSHRAIAQHLHMHRESVIRYARAERFPEKPPRPVSPGILAPYETYLRARFLQGERNVLGLFRELVARGYPGSRMTVERFVLGLRAMEQQGLPIAEAGDDQRNDAPPGGGLTLATRGKPDP